MKERGILFSAPMVRAILENRKTQTRRIISPKPIVKTEHGCWYPNEAKGLHYASEQHFRDGMPADFSPYGVHGDRLWVRETFRNSRMDDSMPTWYRADNLELTGEYCGTGNWKPSIFMPRWASRITLEIVSARVERLQEISHKDAQAEGVDDDMARTVPFEEGKTMAQSTYRQLWNDINGKKYPWTSNPFVWVIEFKRV